MQGRSLPSGKLIAERDNHDNWLGDGVQESRSFEHLLYDYIMQLLLGKTFETSCIPVARILGSSA